MSHATRGGRPPSSARRGAFRSLRRRIASWIEPKPKADPRWDIPIGIGLQGASELRTAIGLTEEGYLRVAGQSHADARGYLLYTAADEVQKTAIYLMRLREYVQGEVMSPFQGQLERTIVTQVLEDSQARERRLLELLTVLVLFATCNEQDYYRHLLLLEELDDLVAARDDRKEFYGVPSNNVIDSIAHQSEWTREVAGSLDGKKIWYSVDSVDLSQPEKLRPGRILSSQRQRIRRALPLMTPGERLLFGLTYGASYGEASETIHYSPSRQDAFLPDDERAFGATALGLLALSVLARAYQLLGKPDLPLARKISDALARSDAAKLVARAAARPAEVGDIVLAGDNLAEALEVAESPYGLVSYKVHYLAERPKPTVDEDWFPALHIVRLYGKSDFRDGVRRMAAKGLITPEEGDKLRSLDDAHVAEAVRGSVTRTWQMGLRDWIRGRGRRK